MDIINIKLKNSGFNGLDVVILKQDEREGRKKIKKDTERPRHPIHLGLEIPFKDLRFHLLQLCDIINDEMDKASIDAMINECEVTEVDIEPEYFIIKGTKGKFSEKSFILKTVKVEAEDDYEHYDTVMKIIDKIVEETTHYLEGSAKVTDEDVVIRWIGAGKEKGFDMDSFNELSPEDKKNFCQKILEESFGAVVLMNEDIDISDVDTSEVTDSFVVGAPIIIEPQAEAITLPK